MTVMQNPPVKEWRRGQYLISTDTGLLELDAINAAFGSDAMPWAVSLPVSDLRKAVDASLCLGLYSVSGDPDQPSKRKTIGLSRVVTDFVTFGYLTDVYVLEEFQGQGLGKWMMQCLGELIDEWPFLRRLVLLTMTADAARLYKNNLGVVEWGESPSAKLVLLEKRGGSARV